MTVTDLLFQWLVAIGVGIILAFRGQLTPFHPTTLYLAFHLIVFCLRPTFIVAFDFDSAWEKMVLTPHADDMRTTLHLSSIALIIFCFFFSVVCNYRGPSDHGEPAQITPEVKKGFFVMLALLAPIGFYSIFAAEPSGERVGGVYVMTGTSGYTNDLQQIFVSITVLFILVNRWKWYSYLPLLAFIFYRATQGWSRWTIILSILALALIYLWEHRKNIPPLRFILPLPILFILFINMSHDRMYFQRILDGDQSRGITAHDSSRDFKERFDGPDFANFDYLTYIVSKVPAETRTFTYGTQHLQIFTEPIPRRFWQNKPVGPPINFFDLNDYGNFIGLTPSLVGDGWMSGGWFGVFVNMAVAGLLLGLAYNWFINNQHNIFKTCIFIIFCSVLIQLFRDGSIVSMAKFLLFTLLPVLLWQFLTRTFFPSQQEDEIMDDEEAQTVPR